MHVPVLYKEVCEFLEPNPGNFIVDGTVGGGGHARCIEKGIAPHGTLLAIDRDKKAIGRFRGSEHAKKVKVICHEGSYADLHQILTEHDLGLPDGILLDLGFSSEQLGASGRGFSFKKDEPLIMTYNENDVPLRDLLAKLNEAELTNIIRENGGERMAKRISRAICEAQKRKRIETSGELARIVRGALPKNYERGRIDPATRTFQALRMYANDELGHINKFLEILPQVLAPKGRILIISFHSLEDRMVKHAFHTYENEGVLELITKKPIAPSLEEKKENPRSRSAKLRVARLRANHS
jgi:16S rRNA (cytosine1402-N4)-methyltransferase